MADRTANRIALLSCLVTLLSATPAVCHPPDGDHHVTHRTLQLPTIEGNSRPWSAKPVLNAEDRFHFVVMTDRTGGHRPGVWMHGVRNVNLLRPEFVVSVGDLIEGYTEDVNEIESQWKEFLGFIDQMEMRFFFVAGNHDVTNPTMHRIWRQHFGREWYSFDYQGVHFVCLSSEDPQTSIGSEQLEWVLSDLAENAEARWTFVFLHKPLWVYAEQQLTAGNGDNTNWKHVEAALGDRPHTVFAGHVHHYVQFERGGHEYYQLGTTGGSSQLRGQPYGEFDHITWVTMETDGPRIANILLDGVLAPDVVTEEGIARFRGFINATQFYIEPILLEPNVDFTSAELRLNMMNEFDGQVTARARVDGLPLEGLTLVPTLIEETIPPHARRETVFRIDFARPLSLERLTGATVNVTVRSTEDPAPLMVERTVPVVIDTRRLCPQLEIAIDGQLDDWEGEWESIAEQPATLGAGQQWQGPGDGSVRFRVAHNDEFLYFSGIVRDDVIQPDRDRLLFSLDARPMADRNATSRLDERSLTITLRPAKDAADARVRIKRPQHEGERIPAEQVAVAASENGYTFEFAIPVETLDSAQGSDWDSFQLNLVMLDIDEPADQDMYVLWRPGAEPSGSNTNYAHFFATSAGDE
jgi:hypothetical protein